MDLRVASSIEEQGIDLTVHGEEGYGSEFGSGVFVNQSAVEKIDKILPQKNLRPELLMAAQQCAAYFISRFSHEYGTCKNPEQTDR